MSSVNVECKSCHVVVIFIYYLLNVVYHPSAIVAMSTKTKNKHTTKLGIAKQKQINRRKNSSYSAMSFSHSGDEAPLVRQ
jgi:hypothetical protein